MTTTVADLSQHDIGRLVTVWEDTIGSEPLHKGMLTGVNHIADTETEYIAVIDTSPTVYITQLHTDLTFTNGTLGCTGTEVVTYA